jgi:probable rRNA maturation factor
VDPSIDEQRVRVLVAASLFEAGAGGGEQLEVGVTFCSPERIAGLNAEHRGVQGPTDVLSFPIDGLLEELPPGMPRAVGDVVVCPEYVRGQLAEGTTMQDDATLGAAVERCVVHGVLHLCGFDHERSEVHAAEMLGLEQLVLDRVRGA